jgi:hypothetical protein
MARSCGIRVGPRHYELVVLDGSPRKHRISAFATGEFPRGGEDPVADAVATLKHLAKQHDIPADSIGAAIDSGQAAFRSLKLPLTDVEKIGDVIKFEVEGQLPQWDIDEVIVDYLKLGEESGTSDLLVTAVRKSDLAREISVLTKAGLEPLEVEIEATAMVNAALAADICHPDDAQVLVHIGEVSTAVVVVDGGQVRSMRAIHIGSHSHEPGVVSPGAPVESEGEGAEAGKERAEPAAPPAVLSDESEQQKVLLQNVLRIRREIGRTLSGARTKNPIEAVYVCGWELPDLIGTQILDVPVYELDVFEENSGQPAQGAAPLVVAYGAALRQLGSAAVPASLRREELRYAGTLERIELPLAIAALLLVTSLAIFNIFEKSQLQHATQNARYWFKSAVNYMLDDPKRGYAGKLERPHKEVDDYFAKLRKANEKPGITAENNPLIDEQRSPYEQMTLVDAALKRRIAELNIELGNTGEVAQPQSSLEAMTRVLGVLADLGEERVGRTAIKRIESRYEAGTETRPDTIRITLSMSFFADTALEATNHLEQQFLTTLRAQPWVVEVPERGSKEFPDGMGIFIESLIIVCDLSKLTRETAP